MWLFQDSGELSYSEALLRIARKSGFLKEASLTAQDLHFSTPECLVDKSEIPERFQKANTRVWVEGVEGRGYTGKLPFYYSRLNLATLAEKDRLTLGSPERPWYVSFDPAVTEQVTSVFFRGAVTLQLLGVSPEGTVGYSVSWEVNNPYLYAYRDGKQFFDCPLYLKQGTEPTPYLTLP